MFKPMIWMRGQPGFVGGLDRNAFYRQNLFELSAPHAFCSRAMYWKIPGEASHKPASRRYNNPLLHNQPWLEADFGLGERPVR